MVNGDRPFLILVNGDWKNKIVVIGDCEHFGDSDFAKNSSVISDGEFFSTVNGDFFYLWWRVISIFFQGDWWIRNLLIIDKV